MPYTMEAFRKYYREKALTGISLEERLQGLSSEYLLKAFPPEERIKDISDEECDRLASL